MDEKTVGTVYRYDPVPLTHVHEMYYPGVFGDFEANVTRRIAELRSERSFLNDEKVRFFEYLLSIVDVDRFNGLQDRYVNPPVQRGCVKYLDPTTWFEHKLNFAHLLGLHKKSPMRILDLGTGPTHFMVVAQFYGHEAVGTDLPPQATHDDPAPFYDALAEIYGTTRIIHRIEPYGELSDIPGKFNLVTAFSVAFNLANRDFLWTVDHWKFFLRSLKKNVLSGRNSALFMTLMRKKLDDEVWSFLKERSDYVADREKYLRVTDFSRLS